MELKDRFHKIEEQSNQSQSERSIRMSKILGKTHEIIPWKSNVTAQMSHSPKTDSSWDETLDLFQKSLTQFLQLESIQLNVLNLADEGTSITHELAVLFAQANELPFELENSTINFRMIGQHAYLEIALLPETKNLVKEAVSFADVWNKRYQNQLKMNFSFLLGKATLKISYKSGTATKKKHYSGNTEVSSEV